MKQLYRIIHFSSLKYCLLIMLINLLFWNNLLFANSIFDAHIISDTSKVSTIATPLYFIKNNGQYPSEFKYKLQTTGLNLIFFDTSITYQFYSQQKPVNTAEPSDNKINAKVNNISLSFLNASKDALLLGNDELETKTNFFIGNNPANWQADVPTFKTLLYKNIYHNIDIKYYSLKGKIKYDIIVHPEANINEVQFHYDGIERVMKTNDGKLLLITKNGNYTEDIPEAYQIINDKRQAVQIDYQIQNNSLVTFRIMSAFDSSSDLIIDPALIYSTFIGGSNDDYIYLGYLVKDNQGCIYTCGQTMSTNFPVTPGAYDVSINGNYDCFVFKLNKTGTDLVYATFIGGSDIDQPNSVEIDKNTNELYIAGTTASTNFPVTAGSYQTTYAGGGYDVFVIKLNNTGSSLLYSTYVGGPINDQCHTVKIDESNNVYVVGQTSGGFPVTPGTYQTVYGGGLWDEYAFKLNPTGTSLLFATYVGGTGDDRGCGTAIDQNHNIYVYGMTTSGIPTTPGAFQTSYGGGTNDVCLSKLNPTGTALIYSTNLGGPGDDYMRGGIEVDNNEQAYITGLCSLGFPVTSGAYDVTHNGSYDVFVTKVKKDGNGLMFSTFLGGSSDDIGFNLAFNSNKEVFVTGQASDTYPVTPCAYDITFNGVNDGFISKLDSTGAHLLYSTFIGGSNYDRGSSLVVDGDTIYVVGYTQSSNFPTTTACFDATYNGGTDDVFALKLLIENNITIDFDCQPSACTGENISFTNNSSGATSYVWSFGDGNSSTNPNPVYSYPTAGTYYITLTATGTCGNGSHTDTITILPSPAFSVSHDTTICSGSTITLNASGAISYSWNTTPVQNGSSITVSPSSSTSYIVTATDINGCSNTADISIQVNSVTPISVTATPQTICPGNSSTLTATGSNNYIWNTVPQQNGSTIIVNPISSTTYIVSATDASGCSTTVNISVQVISNIPIYVSANPQTVCPGNSSTLTATGGTSYTWNTVPPQNGSSIIVNPITTTTYTVIGSDNNCSGMASVTVVVDSILVVTTSVADADCGLNDGSATVNVGSGNYTYLWSTLPPQTTQTVIGLAVGNYSVTVEDNGCVGVANVIISNSDSPSAGSYPKPEEIPNVFTPNDDNLNDLFEIIYHGCEPFHLIVYNRWGRRIFESNDPANQWNGKSPNKQKVAEDIYFYVLTIGSRSYNGSVTILR